MHKHFITITTFILLAFGAAAQPYGDSVRARLGSRHREGMISMCNVQLGYLDTNVVTRQQFLDNLEVGLRLVGPCPSSTAVYAYTLSWMPKGGDVYGGIRVEFKSEISRSLFDEGFLNPLKSSDKIFIENIRLLSADDHVRKSVNIVLTIK